MVKQISVFISRELDPKSDFRAILESAGYKVTGHTCVSLTPIEYDWPEVAPDWVFFASQNAVRFFFEYATAAQIEHWKTQKAVKWASIGAATAKKLLEHVGHIHFYGDGEPISTSRAFKRVASGQRVVFPGAVQSRESIQSLLKDSIDAHTLRIYNNEATADLPLRHEDILVFTSPLNVWAYFKINSPKRAQEIVAIGAATAQALEKSGVMGITISPEPNELCLAETVMSLKIR
jgi:hydroxymethylbilane synthase